MKCFFIGILFLLFIQNGFALQCYECDTTWDSKSCDNKDLIRDCSSQQQSCIKTVKMIRGETIIKKQCLDGPEENKCEDIEDNGMKETVCRCSENLCNNAELKLLTKSVMFCAMFTTVLIQFI